MTNCIACKNKIPDGANICSECKSYQSAWKNNLQYAAGVSALLLFVLSSLVWILPKAWNFALHSNDVRIIAADSGNSVVIANFSNEEIFVSHFVFWMTGRTSNWISPRVIIEETIPPGKIIRRKFPKRREQRPLYSLKGAPKDKIENLIVRAVQDDPCVQLVIHTEDDYSLRELRKVVGPTLNTFPASAYLEYWSGSSKRPRFLTAKSVGTIDVCASLLGKSVSKSK